MYFHDLKKNSSGNYLECLTCFNRKKKSIRFWLILIIFGITVFILQVTLILLKYSLTGCLVFGQFHEKENINRKGYQGDADTSNKIH